MMVSAPRCGVFITQWIPSHLLCKLPLLGSIHCNSCWPCPSVHIRVQSGRGGDPRMCVLQRQLANREDQPEWLWALWGRKGQAAALLRILAQLLRDHQAGEERLLVGWLQLLWQVRSTHFVYFFWVLSRFEWIMRAAESPTSESTFGLTQIIVALILKHWQQIDNTYGLDF